jgi:hypothetical protein
VASAGERHSGQLGFAHEASQSIPAFAGWFGCELVKWFDSQQGEKWLYAQVEEIMREGLPAGWDKERALWTFFDRCRQKMICARSNTGELIDAPSGHPLPPKCAGLFLTIFAKSPAAAEAAIGDIHERFARDCGRYGVRYATLYCWGHTLRCLGPLLWRAFGRAMKWAAIISAVRRYFTG